MIVEIPNGEVVDITTLLGAADTDRISIESNFDTRKPVYLTLSATPPVTTDDCEASLQGAIDAPFCQRVITGETGKKVYAMTSFSTETSPVKVRASKG